MRTDPGDLVVLFDIDGTLAVSSSAHLDALAHAAQATLGIEATFSMQGERPVLNGQVVSGWVDGQCFRLLAEQAGHDWSALEDETLEVYAATYLGLLADGADAGRVLPGVPELLDRLAHAGVRMGLCTGNASAIAQAKLAALGIGHHFSFDAALGFGERHPDRSSVAAAAAVAAVSQAGSIYLVGDTRADMHAAVANNVCGVGVCTGADNGPALAQAGATYVLAAASELDGLLGLRSGRWFPTHVPGMVSAADLWMDSGQRDC